MLQNASEFFVAAFGEAAGGRAALLCAACNEDAPSNYKMMKRWLLLAAARAAAEDLAFVREGCRISIHGARAILRDGARECDLWNAQSSGRRCASDRVLLCEVAFADQKAAASTHAALTVATDAAYLTAPIPGGLPRYKYVMAKAAWARAAGVAYYLAFGRGTAKANGPRCDAGAGGQTMHALKAAGLGVVMRHTEYESVTALDVGAVPALDAAHPEAWLALDAASDVFGASNVGKPVLVNGGVLVLRNTAWARGLVRAWWRNRCGPYDQYALWKSLAELWRRDYPKFRFSDGVFANYASARGASCPRSRGASRTARSRPGAAPPTPPARPFSARRAASRRRSRCPICT